ncbi:MAG: AMP-binding protein [Actinobacteria bacterium]|nr:AMP-binding protein [Actinomycetota bacterium]
MTISTDTEAAVSEMPLSPLSFLIRSARVWENRPAVIDGNRTFTYGEHYQRVRRGVGALRDGLGVEAGDRVAALLPNIVEMLELHYSVPGASAVLVPLNTRLAGSEYAYILEHSGARVVIADASLRAPLTEALEALGANAPRVLWTGEGELPGESWNALVERSQPLELSRPDDERALLSISYTSGTTGRPKGVMTSHRGAYLHTLGVIAEAGLGASSSYLWTLPMFHCNGWAYTWAVTASGARHVCLRSVEAGPIWDSLRTGVTHLCAAPTVLFMLVDAEQAEPCANPVQVFVGGAPPAPTLLARAAELNIHVTHLYGLTETYGPTVVCAWNPDWDDRSEQEQASLRARQGVATIVTELIRVVDPEMRDVAADGESLGEIVMRGNNIMVGYYEDPEATVRAFTGGWFHTGDIGVMHPDGYLEIRDRLKDVVISGGENIATVEIEQALMAHPAIAEAAVVGAPDPKWGEVPVAFATLRGAERPDPEELREFARGRIARFKVPKRIEFLDELPKTGTGKIQKFALRERT